MVPNTLTEWWTRFRKGLALRAYHRALATQRLRGKPILHLLHVGKTGGTAVKEALSPVRDVGPYRLELHAHDFTLKDVPTGDKVAFFLRDPTTRFVSGFYSRQRSGQPRYNSQWTRAEREAFTRFQTANDLARSLSSGDPTTRRAAEKAMKSIAHVRSSYWEWFDTRDYFASRLPDIVFIGFQEDLEEDFRRLTRMLGLSEAITLPSDDVRAHRNPRNLDTRLDEGAVRNLARWYAADYAFVNLCKERARSNGASRPR